MVNNIGLVSDPLDMSARTDNFHLGAKLFPKAVNHSFDKSNITNNKTCLHGVYGISSNDRGRGYQFNRWQFCCSHNQGFSGSANSRQNRAAQIFRIFSKSIESCGCSKVDHTGRSAIFRLDSDSVGNPVRANRIGIIVQDFNIEFQIRIDRPWCDL